MTILGVLGRFFAIFFAFCRLLIIFDRFLIDFGSMSVRFCFDSALIFDKICIDFCYEFFNDLYHFTSLKEAVQHPNL